MPEKLGKEPTRFALNERKWHLREIVWAAFILEFREREGREKLAGCSAFALLQY
jgi:hypothetical protein